MKKQLLVVILALSSINCLIGSGGRAFGEVIRGLSRTGTNVPRPGTRTGAEIPPRSTIVGDRPQTFTESKTIQDAPGKSNAPRRQFPRAEKLGLLPYKRLLVAPSENPLDILIMPAGSAKNITPAQIIKDAQSTATITKNNQQVAWEKFLQIIPQAQRALEYKPRIESGVFTIQPTSVITISDTDTVPFTLVSKPYPVVGGITAAFPTKGAEWTRGRLHGLVQNSVKDIADSLLRQETREEFYDAVNQGVVIAAYASENGIPAQILRGITQQGTQYSPPNPRMRNAKYIPIGFDYSRNLLPTEIAQLSDAVQTRQATNAEITQEWNEFKQAFKEITEWVTESGSWQKFAQNIQDLELTNNAKNQNRLNSLGIILGALLWWLMGDEDAPIEDSGLRFRPQQAGKLTQEAPAQNTPAQPEQPAPQAIPSTQPSRAIEYTGPTTPTKDPFKQEQEEMLSRATTETTTTKSGPRESLFAPRVSKAPIREFPRAEKLGLLPNERLLEVDRSANPLDILIMPAGSAKNKTPAQPQQPAPPDITGTQPSRGAIKYIGPITPTKDPLEQEQEEVGFIETDYDRAVIGMLKNYGDFILGACNKSQPMNLEWANKVKGLEQFFRAYNRVVEKDALEGIKESIRNFIQTSKFTYSM